MPKFKIHGRLYEVIGENIRKVITGASVASVTTGTIPDVNVTVDDNGNAKFNFVLPEGGSGSGSIPATEIPKKPNLEGAVGISAKYAREDHIHPLEIGGRNLVLDSSSEKTNTTSSSSTKSIRYDLSDYGKSVLTIGQQCTISFEAKASIEGIKISGRYIRKANGTVVCNYTDKNQTITLSTEWKRYSGTCSITAEGAEIFYILIPSTSSANETVYIKNPKIEIGNITSDYIEAPEYFILTTEQLNTLNGLLGITSS